MDQGINYSDFSKAAFDVASQQAERNSFLIALPIASRVESDSMNTKNIMFASSYEVGRPDPCLGLGARDRH